MASFNWVKNPGHGVCLTCGTSDTPRGFVNMYADVNVKSPATSRSGGGGIIGVVDLYLCGQCLETAARMVGSASGKETQELAQQHYDLTQELDKTKDEVKAWMQRYDNVIEAITNKDVIPDQDGPRRPSASSETKEGPKRGTRSASKRSP